MKDRIRTELFSLEEERGIHIVNARERGSQMLGVTHEESDYDVLFLFAQDCAVYAMLTGRTDSIHRPDDPIDLHGWNIDKFAKLIADSNPNAIEYCREGATEYIGFPDAGVFDALTEETRENFNHMSLYYHYISMAKNNWKKYIETGKERTKGRQFYVARAIACAQYIRRVGELPPMNVFDLAEARALDNELKRTLRALAESKTDGRGDTEFRDVVGDLYQAESDAPMEPTDERTRSPDAEVIDAFIKEAVVR